MAPPYQISDWYGGHTTSGASCLAIVSADVVGGLFLLLALRYGTGYQTVERSGHQQTPSSVH